MIADSSVLFDPQLTFFDNTMYHIQSFLKQDITESYTFEETLNMIHGIVEKGELRIEKDRRLGDNLK